MKLLLIALAFFATLIQCRTASEREVIQHDPFLPESQVRAKSIGPRESSIAIGAYPYYAEDPFLFYQVQHGQGSFQGRSLREYTLREKLQNRSQEGRSHQTTANPIPIGSIFQGR
ncbi:hypothetical protein LPTSP4_08890 [Leptospira ryugenii]|uniref:Lipoprotein n=1 Tax=Leptospira ryugenii TaxID=1917863 RepID=A0A2P2DXL4_9LEPT|nr:hypothetical protein [Leptospira ryugenii]GBF49378.1 hypothetical protein LPTSP4_08890 [Leptospira ryugenii]